MTAEVLRVFSHEHNSREVAAQEYELAKEHFREVVMHRDSVRPRAPAAVPGRDGPGRRRRGTCTSRSCAGERVADSLPAPRVARMGPVILLMSSAHTKLVRGSLRVAGTRAHIRMAEPNRSDQDRWHDSFSYGKPCGRAATSSRVLPGWKRFTSEFEGQDRERGRQSEPAEKALSTKWSKYKGGLYLVFRSID